MSPAPSNGVAARADQLTKVFGEKDTRVVALDAVTVDFHRGQLTAIMGPSGSGKSTLMHCMAALDSVTDGQVYIGDVEVTRLDDKRLTRLRRDKIGFIFQAYNLVPKLTALETITLPLDIAGRKPNQEWLDTVIDTVGLRDRLSHRPSELAGGQQQRTAAARALAAGAAGEPASADGEPAGADAAPASEVRDADAATQAARDTASS